MQRLERESSIVEEQFGFYCTVRMPWKKMVPVKIKATLLEDQSDADILETGGEKQYKAG